MEIPIVDYLTNPVTEEELLYAGIMFSWSDDNNIVQQSDDQNYMIDSLSNDEGRPIDNGAVEESDDEWIKNLLNDDDRPIENGMDEKFVEESHDYMIKNLGNDEDRRPIDNGIVEECYDGWIGNFLNDEDLHIDNGIGKELVEECNEWVKILLDLDDDDRPIENGMDKKFVEESNDYMIKNLGNDEDHPIENSSGKIIVEESIEYMIKNLGYDEDRPIEYGSDENLVEESNEYVIKNVPPGYRFRPKDEELIRDFLAKKIYNMPLLPNIIQEVQLYNHHPRDICQNHELIRANEWYFFTLRQKKYSNGTRPNRTTGGNNGFWKATGGDVKIKTGQHEIGLKKTLVYYEGKAKDRNGGKTNWIMHEYRIDETTSRIAIPSTRSNSNDTMIDYDWVLCRIYHRQTSKPKNDEGASRFSESFDIEN